MALQIELIQRSFETIMPYGEVFVASFYRRLFAHQPETQRFFTKLSMDRQYHKLLMMLVLIVENLNKPEYLAEILKRLGTIHSFHHIQAEHYQMVGAALLDALAAYFGSAWRPDLQEAWADAYHTIVSLMLQGYPALDIVSH